MIEIPALQPWNGLHEKDTETLRPAEWSHCGVEPLPSAAKTPSGAALDRPGDFSDPAIFWGAISTGFESREKAGAAPTKAGCFFPLAHASVVFAYHYVRTVILSPSDGGSWDLDARPPGHISHNPSPPPKVGWVLGGGGEGRGARQ